MSALDLVNRFAARLESLTSNLGIPTGKLGNVVVLPGILGSELADATGRHLWSLPPLLDELLLAPDGVSEAEPGRTIQATDLNLVYLPLLHVLELSWDVFAFSYDWRRSIPETARLLTNAVKHRFAGAAFHIVAHSMGGLVARVMVQSNPDIQRGGKLLMLGTPNHGSFLAYKALTLDAAAFFRAIHNEVPSPLALAAARTWPSVYQLLPCPLQDAEARQFYEHPPPDLSEQHLAAAAQLHQDLDAMVVTDSMLYVGGSGFLTLDGSTNSTFEGDGVVSHRLGFLRGARTFTVVSGHMSLVTNPLVVSAVTPLLKDGNKMFLTEVPNAA